MTGNRDVVNKKRSKKKKAGREGLKPLLCNKRGKQRGETLTEKQWTSRKAASCPQTVNPSLLEKGIT